MRIIRIFGTTFLLLLLLLFSCSEDQSKKKAYKGSDISILEDVEGFHGWDSVTLRNAFTRLDVVSDLAGKILGYEAAGYQIMWHNPSLEGEIEPFQRNDLGQEFINTGGAKVWPAPQEKWGGPPDRILDGLPYTYTLEGDSITVTSPEDSGNDRTGLQFKHTFSLKPSSTVVELNLSMTNVVDHPVEWALWHLATIPGITNSTVYAPVNDGNWDLMVGKEDNAQWLGVDNGMFRARFNKTTGKVGMKVSKGWAAWHNEENDVVFAMFFPVKNGVEYPHGGHNFEIWSNGAVNNSDGSFSPEMAHMELEVLGPFTRLLPGESTSLNLQWAVCHCSNVKKVLPGGILVEEIKRDENNIVTGKFGVFYSGTLEEYFVDKDGNKKGRNPIGDVSPLTEVTFRREPIIPLDAVTLRYQVMGYDHNLLCVLGEVSLE